MKRSIGIVALLILGIITLTLSACDTLSPPEISSASGSGASTQNTGIWVSGEGSVTVVPDVAVLSLGVEADAATVAAAQNQAALSMNAVIGVLNESGVAEADIQTQRFSIAPIRQWDRDKEEEIILGYRVTNLVSVKIRDIATTGSVIDAVATAGGDNARVNSISFTVDDPAAFKDEARQLAMQDAKGKAGQLAEAAGVRLGAPIYINESGGFRPVVIESAMPALAAPAPTTSISAGELEIRLSVQVVYAIR